MLCTGRASPVGTHGGAHQVGHGAFTVRRGGRMMDTGVR